MSVGFYFPILRRKKNPIQDFGKEEEGDRDFQKFVPHFNAKLWCFIAASFSVLNSFLQPHPSAWLQEIVTNYSWGGDWRKKYSIFNCLFIFFL